MKDILLSGILILIVYAVVNRGVWEFFMMDLPEPKEPRCPECDEETDPYELYVNGGWCPKCNHNV